MIGIGQVVSLGISPFATVCCPDNTCGLCPGYQGVNSTPRFRAQRLDVVASGIPVLELERSPDQSLQILNDCIGISSKRTVKMCGNIGLCGMTDLYTDLAASGTARPSLTSRRRAQTVRYSVPRINDVWTITPNQPRVARKPELSVPSDQFR